MFKFITEFGPLIAFFVGYKTGDILTATLYMLVASTISICMTWIVERSVNKVNLVSTGLLLVSGSLTLFSGNAMFIKMKPTILYLLFAAFMFLTSKRGKPAIRFVLERSVRLVDDISWTRLNTRFIMFFILMAISNEIIWRSFSEATWVNFKVFGAIPLTLLFIFSQVPFIMRNSVREQQ